jgi:hypothetical protein
MPAIRTLVCLSTLVVAIGCGSEERPAANSAPAANASAAKPDPAADRRIAEEAAARLDDLPSGWVEEGGGEEVETSCTTISAASRAATGAYSSPEFSEGDGPVASNVVFVYPDEPAAQRGFEQITSEGTHSCYAELMTGFLASDPDVEIGETEAKPLSLDLAGDQVTATRVTVPMSGVAIELESNTDLVVVRVGRGVTISSFIDGNGPFDADIRDTLSAATVERLTAGLK